MFEHLIQLERGMFSYYDSGIEFKFSNIRHLLILYSSVSCKILDNRPLELSYL